MMVALTASNVNDWKLQPSETIIPYRVGKYSELWPQSAAALSLIFPDEPLTGTPHV